MTISRHPCLPVLAAFVLAGHSVRHTAAISVHETKSIPAAVTATNPLSAVCANEPMRSTGTKHYFCDCGAGSAAGCIPGDDANPGTSRSAPKRTGTALRTVFDTMQAGDTIAICRGGAINSISRASSAYNLFNPHCRANNTCDVRDYDPRPTWGNGSEQRPIIIAANGFGFHLGDNAAAHDEGYRFFNLDITGPTNGIGFSLSNDLSDVDICNVRIHDTSAGVFIYSSNVPGTGLTRRITIRHNQFVNLGAMGVLGGCNECVIDGNYFNNNGTTLRDHAIYLSGENAPGTDDHDEITIQNMRVANNEIHSPAGSASVMVQLVVHGRYKNLLIENNNIIAEGNVTGSSFGIAVDHGGYPIGGDFTGTIIRRNRVINAGGAGIKVDQCPDCVVESNVITMGTAGGPAITVGEYAPRAVMPPDAMTTRVTVRNNTIYVPYSYSYGVSGIRVVGQGKGHVVADNAIQFLGSSAWTCFDLPLLAPSYSLVDNNLCRYSAGGWQGAIGGNGQSFRAWRAANPAFDRASLVSDPRFVNAPADFTPALGSPLIGGANASNYAPSAIGKVTWSATDTGKARDAAPDIGAFER
jgi:hypothetical protein